MTERTTSIDRRQFLGGLTISALAYSNVARGSFADELTRTPRQTEGPFYPSELPLDTDNDLLIINDRMTRAVGTITHLTGRVLSPSGEPIRNAEVEIWQVDNNGVYLHPGSARSGSRDTNFQGFGRFLTSSTGEYYFRTIKPVAYDFRTPHIHFIVKQGESRLLTTQMYIRGEELNQRDTLYKRVPEGPPRDSVTVAFQPLEGSTIGEESARFDLVVGLTPEDPEEDQLRGGLRRGNTSRGRRPRP